MDNNRLTLFIPGLLDKLAGFEQLIPQDLAGLSALTRLLSRAKVANDRSAGFLPGLFELFNIDAPTQYDFPVAAVTCTSESNQHIQNEYLLHADPVCIQPDRQHAVLIAHDALQVSQDEAEQLIASVNAFFAEDGWQLCAHTPQRWYLRGVRLSDIQTFPLHDVMGKNIQPYLPQGNDSVYWHKLLNEVQMLLHSHPVNLQRAAQGKLPVNSLWFWGGGKLPDAEKVDWQCVHSNEPLAIGLAGLTGCHHKALPVSFSVDAFSDCSDALLVFEQLLPLVAVDDLFGWLDELKGLNDNWFMPLLDALESKTISELTIIPANGKSYRITRKHLKRWWHRQQDLKKFIQ